MTYLYVHTVPDCLDSGKPLFFGDEVELSQREASQPHNKFLLTENRLVVVQQETAPSGRSETTTKENV